MAKETFKEKFKDRRKKQVEEQKQNIGIAKNRVRGTVNIFRGKGTLVEKFKKTDAFNARTQGVLDMFKKK